MVFENRKKNEFKSGYLWLFIILLMVTAAALLLFPVCRDLQRKQQEEADLEKKLNSLKEERNQRQVDIDAMQNSPSAVEKIAREKFHMVRKGETVMLIEENVSRQ